MSDLGTPADPARRRHRASETPWSKDAWASQPEPVAPVEQLSDVDDADWHEVEDAFEPRANRALPAAPSHQAASELASPEVVVPELVELPDVQESNGDEGPLLTRDAEDLDEEAEFSALSSKDSSTGPSTEPELDKQDLQVPVLQAVAARASLSAHNGLTLIDPKLVTPDGDELASAISIAGTAGRGRRIIISMDYRRAPNNWRDATLQARSDLKNGRGLRGRRRIAGFGSRRVNMLAGGVAALALSAGIAARLGVGLALQAAPVLLIVGVLAGAFPALALRVARALVGLASKLVKSPGQPTAKRGDERYEMTPTEQEWLAEIDAKLKAVKKPAQPVEGVLRVTVTGPEDDDERELREVCSSVQEALGVYGTEHQQLVWQNEDARAALVGGQFPRNNEFVISSAELGELARVPDGQCKPRDVKVSRLNYMPLAADHIVPVPDPLRPPHEVLPIGSDGYGTLERQLGIDGVTTDKHFVCFGGTGSGKSTMAEHLAFATAYDGLPMVWIDPHGVNTSNLRDYIIKFAPHRLDDVVMLDPGDKHGRWSLAYNPMAVYPLSKGNPARSDAEADAAYAVVMDLLESEASLVKTATRARPMASQAVRALLQANMHLSEDNQMNLVHIPPFFTNAEFRLMVMEFCTDPAARATYGPGAAFNGLSPQAQADQYGPIVRGIDRFSDNKAFARVFVSPTNRVAIPHLLAENKLVLLRLSRFSNQKKMGEFLAAALLPSILHNMEVFGYSRDDDTGEERGARCRIFIDECRLFFRSEKLAEVMESGLFEARKFRTQYFFFGQQPGQIPASGQKALFGNTYCKMGLLNSDPDELNRFARTMSGNGHQLKGEDFAGLPPFHGYIKYLARTPDGSEMSVGPHSFKQLPAPDYTLRTPEEKATRTALVERARKLYYNRTEDMDERRAHFVELVFAELATKLAERANPSALIAQASAGIGVPVASSGNGVVTEDLALDERDPDDPSNIWG